MPFLDFPARGLNLYYTINPKGPAPTSIKLPPPETGPIDPQKPILVMLHSTATSTACFAAQGSDPRIQEAFNVVAFDGRFNGRTTSKEVESYTLEDSADDHIAALDLLGFPSYSILGEGIGGSHTAAWIAIKRPAEVVCLVLSSSGPLAKENPEIIDDFLQLSDWLCENKDGKGDTTGAIPEKAVTAMEHYFVGAQDRVKERRVTHAAAFQLRYGAGHSSYEIRHLLKWGSHRKPIPKELLASICVPTLLLHGSADTVVSPLAGVKEWQDSLTGVPGGADLRTITDAPHLLCWTDANVVNRILLAFVGQNNLQL